jgi:hypothetical protein
MSKYDNEQLCSLRATLLGHPIYTQVVSFVDLRLFMEVHVLPSGISCRSSSGLSRTSLVSKCRGSRQIMTGRSALINDIVSGE